MQDYVPLKRNNKTSQMRIISVISIIFIFFIFLIFLAFVLHFKRDKMFKQTTFYFVYAEKSQNSSDLENLSEKIKNLGGAGKIFQYEKYYYLILNVYNDEESAENVVKNNKEIYENISVLKLSSKKISYKTAKTIKQSAPSVSYIKNLNLAFNEIYQQGLEYLAGKISDNDLCVAILKLKFDLEDDILMLKTDKSQKYSAICYEFANLEQMYFNSFFDKVFDSDIKTSVLCEFMVQMALLKLDFFNNL